MIEKNKINSLQASILIFYLAKANFLGVGLNMVNAISKQDMWLSAGIGIIIGFIPLLLFSYIAGHRPSLNIIELNQKIFGKLFGTLLNIIINLLVLFLGIITLSDLIKFIKTNFLMTTPCIIVGLLFMVAVYKIANKGQEVITRAAVALFPIGIIFVIFNILGLNKFIDFNNIKPILEHGITPVLKGSLLYSSIAIMPSFMILIIPKGDITDPKKYNHHMIWWYILASINLFIVFFWVMSILGNQLVELYNYPIYDILKKITFFNFIERVENNFILQWIFDYFFTISLCVFFIKESIQSTIKINKPIWINIIVGTLSLMILEAVTIINTHVDLLHLITKYFGWIMGIGFFSITIIIFIRLLFDQKQT